MTRRYLDDLTQDQEVVDRGRYTVEVVDARSADTSSGGKMIWLDLKVIGGVDNGRVVSASINLPRDGEKGVFFLRKKLRGWSPLISAAHVADQPDEDQPDAICAAILGSQVEAVLSVQAEGQYKGSQQLDETFQPEGSKNVAPPQLQAVAAPTNGQQQQVAVETNAAVAAGPDATIDPNPPF
jgi:hypothetical protein